MRLLGMNALVFGGVKRVPPHLPSTGRSEYVLKVGTYLGPTQHPCGAPGVASD